MYGIFINLNGTLEFLCEAPRNWGNMHAFYRLMFMVDAESKFGNVEILQYAPKP